MQRPKGRVNEEIVLLSMGTHLTSGRTVSYSGTAPEPGQDGHVLVIDDEPEIRQLMSELLESQGYHVRTAGEGSEGIAAFRKGRVRVVISDIRMPNMDGLEVLRRVRDIDETVPVILVTGFGDFEYAVDALRKGAYDFLQKPIQAGILLNTVERAKEHCRLKRVEKDQPRILREQVLRKTRELQESYERIRAVQGNAIFTLAKLAEARDGETAGHLERIQLYTRILCAYMQDLQDYADILTDQYVDDLVMASVLHDIGKVAIADSILLSPEKYGETERRIMKQHTVVGGQHLREAAEETGDESVLSLGRDVAYYHHERWDGQGYPEGLKGEEIPLAARIVALADVYDALTTERRYKRAFSHDEAADLIKENRGKHFDPAVVDAFLATEDNFRRIRALLE